MKNKKSFQWINKVGYWAIFFLILGTFSKSWAVDLDWSGQFWSQYHLLVDYSLDSRSGGTGVDPARQSVGGYYIPGGGRRDASFLNAFLRLRPRLIVNDNLYIKSEWWVGHPVFSLFGGKGSDLDAGNRHDAIQPDPISLSVNRIWAEFVTDMGTVQVGRVPLHWGLGMVWNAGEGLWSRAFSSADALRWMVQVGSFKIIPSFIWWSAGNSVGGSYQDGSPGRPVSGSGNVFDYSLSVQYDNFQDEMQGGVHLLKRVAGAEQRSVTIPEGFRGPAANANQNDYSMNYALYDFFFQKQLARDWRLGFELPVINGHLGGNPYHTSGLAAEMDWGAGENWSFCVRTGYARGQKSSAQQLGNTYQAFYFHPNYRLGQLLFQYQLAALSGPNTLNSTGTLQSPYDTAVNNAWYLAVSMPWKPSDRWTLQPALIHALALETASDSSGYFFNTWSRKMTALGNGVRSQGKSYGWEFDLSLVFQWDSALQVGVDQALFFPGRFFAFSNNAAGENRLDPVYGTSLRVGVVF